MAVDNDVPSGKDKEYRQWSHFSVPPRNDAFIKKLFALMWILNTFFHIRDALCNLYDGSAE